MELTVADINILLEAVDAWEDSDSMMGLTTSMLMLGLGVAGDTAEEKKANLTQTMNEAKAKQENKKEQAIMLKAKLLMLRQKLEVEEVAKEMRGQ